MHFKAKHKETHVTKHTHVLTYIKILLKKFYYLIKLTYNNAYRNRNQQQHCQQNSLKFT